MAGLRPSQRVHSLSKESGTIHKITICLTQDRDRPILKAKTIKRLILHNLREPIHGQNLYDRVPEVDIVSAKVSILADGAVSPKRQRAGTV